MVFFVVAAALPVNDEKANVEQLEKSMFVGGRKAAECYVVKVKITLFLWWFVNILTYVILILIGWEAKI